MSRLIPLLLGICLLGACAAQPAGGLIRPKAMTDPAGYLETVGLNKYGKEVVRTRLGKPTRTMHYDGLTYWTYVVGHPPENRRYTYIFKHGILVNVRFERDSMIERGYDGLTAKQVQSD